MAAIRARGKGHSAGRQAQDVDAAAVLDGLRVEE